MSKDFGFEFYRVFLPGSSNTSFENLIDKLIQDFPVSQRIIEILGRPVYLYEVSDEFININTSDSKEKKIRLIKGMMIRVKIDDLPDWVDTEGAIQPLEDDDKKLGLGEKSVFIYNPETRVFVFQKTQSGASLNSIFNYFQEIFKLGTMIETRVCLNEEAMSRIDKLSEVKKFEIKIASLDSMEIFSGQDKDEDEINKLRKDTRAPFLYLTLSVEHQRTSLDIRFIRDAIAKWLPFTKSDSGARTDIMKLTGSTEEGGSFMMDLIEDKMKELVRVKYQKVGNRRVVTDAERYSALKTAWTRRQESILKMYMHPSDSGRI